MHAKREHNKRDLNSALRHNSNSMPMRQSNRPVRGDGRTKRRMKRSGRY